MFWIWNILLSMAKNRPNTHFTPALRASAMASDPMGVEGGHGDTL